MMIVRALHTIDEFRQVIALEQRIWGYTDAEDAVGIPIFVITVKRGGILIGAFDDDRLVGFVYSLAGIKDGRPMQWSHMLGVLPEYRGTGLGRTLKLEQRRVALDMGMELMEWTYDPLQAVNAHLNFRRLGVIVEEYAQNVYGDSSSTLHRGAPTDRFIAQWWMRSPRVEQTLAGSGQGDRRAPLRTPAALAAGSPKAIFGSPPPTVVEGPETPGPEEGGVHFVNTTSMTGVWLECSGIELGRSDAALGVAIPTAFTEMLDQAPGLAHAWRLATRELFGHYLGRRYQVVDFRIGPGPAEGRYLLERPEQASGPTRNERSTPILTAAESGSIVSAERPGRSPRLQIPPQRCRPFQPPFSDVVTGGERPSTRRELTLVLR